MYVCRTLDKTVVEPSMSCLITPIPSLLAEPSRPIARYGRSVHRCKCMSHGGSLIKNLDCLTEMTFVLCLALRGTRCLRLVTDSAISLCATIKRAIHTLDINKE
jgi:hypothetical protein